MDTLLGHGKVLRILSWMNLYGSSITLLGVGVHCLVALFPFGTVLLVLLAGPPLVGCQLLDMLLIWLLLGMVLFRRLLLMVLVRRSLGKWFTGRPRVWKRLRHVGHSSIYFSS